MKNPWKVCTFAVQKLLFDIHILSFVTHNENVLDENFRISPGVGGGMGVICSSIVQWNELKFGVRRSRTLHWARRVRKSFFKNLPIVFRLTSSTSLTWKLYWNSQMFFSFYILYIFSNFRVYVSAGEHEREMSSQRALKKIWNLPQNI